MKIGYLHIGSTRNGIRRHGEQLARKAKEIPGLEVGQEFVDLSDAQAATPHADMLARAAERLSSFDVVHVQYNKRIWGFDARTLAGRRRHLRNVRTFLRRCRAPIAVTFHDVYLEPSDTQPLQADLAGPVSRGMNLRPRLGLFFEGDRQIARQLMKRASVSFVSTNEEVRRLRSVAEGRHVRCIRLPVEPREAAIDADDARASMGLGSATVVTILGFLVRRKGYALALEAMKSLPSSVHLVLAGSSPSGGEAFEAELRRKTSELGLGDRVHFTGYLSEEALGIHLAATHLALCPFSAVSASASLSTWISAGRPILASKLPQLLEYESIDSGGVRFFEPYDPEELARSIRKLLPQCGNQPDPAVQRLAEKLSLENVFSEHLESYRDVVSTTRYSDTAG